MPIQPSDGEEEYFKREELSRLRRLRQHAARETADAEKLRLRELHWMRCPKCGMELAELRFRGVMVDACFACGGMFFDQGEVDKLEEQPGMIQRMVSSFFDSK